MERLGKLLAQLKNESEMEVPILVEGIRDKESLNRLGITGEILCLKGSYGTMAEILDKVATRREVILLPDFDREGASMARFLVRELNGMRVKANDRIWRGLRSAAKSEIAGVEGLAGYVEKLRRGDQPAARRGTSALA